MSGTIAASAETWFDRFLFHSPAQPLFGRRAARKLVVLAYHDVQDVARFESQMRYLEAETNPVSVDLFLRASCGEEPLPKRAVLVTFDDADRSVYERVEFRSFSDIGSLRLYS
jgi:hypothetical protein